MKTIFILSVIALFAPLATAQRQTFTLNPDASQVKMTLNTTHEVVNGSFHVQSGAINFDRDASTMSGIVTVAADSGKTGNGTRDNRMKNAILLVAQHPTVTFEPKTYTGALAPAGDSTLQVSGIFTLLGIPHPITVPMVVHLDGTNATAKAHFTVPYIQWGLKDPSFLFWKAEKDVTVDLVLTGKISQ